MLESMSSSLLGEWEAYYMEEPFGQIRQDYLLGLLVQMTYNANRGSESPPLTIQEILYPEVVKVSHEEEVAADLAFVESLVQSGKIIDMRDHIKKKGGDLP
jgi:hypothetical protein